MSSNRIPFRNGRHGCQPPAPLFTRGERWLLTLFASYVFMAVGFNLTRALFRPPVPPVCAADVWTVERFQELTARAALQSQNTIGDTSNVR